MSFRYIELFAGIGGFRTALDQLGGECVFASEIDKFATQSYRALYNGASELHGDITQIDAKDIPNHDVLVGGFPCQAFSVAGQRKGFEDTRGTLFFEIARIAKEKQPRLMLLENVKGLLSHDQGRTFETMCVALNEIGYAVDFRVLNSKYFGVPQNRERIFIVCDRDAANESCVIEGNNVVSKAKRRAQELGIRTFSFNWPTESEVSLRLRDILEKCVSEKYYLSEERASKLISELEKRREFTPVEDEKDIVYAGLLGEGFRQINEVLDIDGVCTALRTFQGGGLHPKIAEPQILQRARGNNSGGLHTIAPTITKNAYEQNNHLVTAELGAFPRYRIRKLTPLECWRLQGFSDEQHAIAVAAGISDSQRYKQAGNAVTVNVIRAIGERMVARLALSEAYSVK